MPAMETVKSITRQVRWAEVRLPAAVQADLARKSAAAVRAEVRLPAAVQADLARKKAAVRAVEEEQVRRAEYRIRNIEFRIVFKY